MTHAQIAPSDGPSANGEWAKVRPAERYDSLNHEFRILQHLQQCPFVPRLVSRRVSNNTQSAWFTMQCAVGTPLSRCTGPLDETLCGNIYEAIAAIHQLGVVHCDLKGDHIFVAENGGVMIIDFDLAQFLDEITSNPPLGHPFRGSLRYGSTLTHLGYRPNVAFDFESVGFAFLEQARGKLPWTGLLLKQDDDEHWIKEVGIAKLRWLASTDQLPAAVSQYLTSPHTRSSLGELVATLTSESSNSSSFHASPKRGSEEDRDERGPPHAPGFACASDEVAKHAPEVGQDEEVQFRESLAKTLRSHVTEEKLAFTHISCLDLESFRGNPNCFFQPFQVSETPAERVVNGDINNSNILLEVGSVVSQQQGARTNALEKIDQLHTRLEQLLGTEHPLKLAQKVAYVGIGIQACRSDDYSPEELCEKAAVYLCRTRLQRPADWVMAALGRYLFLSLQDKAMNSPESLGVHWRLISAMSSREYYLCDKGCSKGVILTTQADFQAHLRLHLAASATTTTTGSGGGVRVTFVHKGERFKIFVHEEQGMAGLLATAKELAAGEDVQRLAFVADGSVITEIAVLDRDDVAKPLQKKRATSNFLK